MARSKALLVTVGLCVACLVGSGVANAIDRPVAQSWSLDRDLAANARSDSPANPFADATGHKRVWSMRMTRPGSTARRPPYRVLTAFQPNAATCGVPSLISWSDPSGAPVAFMNLSSQTYHGTTCGPGQVLKPAVAYIHPSNAPASGVFAWRAPVGGTVTITGGMSDADCSGGNGIRWFVDLNRRNLDTGTFDNCGRSTFKAGLTVKVRPGDSLYFIVDANGDWLSDATRVKVTITAKAA